MLQQLLGHLTQFPESAGRIADHFRAARTIRYVTPIWLCVRPPGARWARVRPTSACTASLPALVNMVAWLGFGPRFPSLSLAS